MKEEKGKTKAPLTKKIYGKENEPKNTRPDIKRIFQTLSGANRQIIKQKPKQNNTEKHKTNTDTQKQKFAPENFFQTATLRRENRNKDKRHRTRHEKTKQEKKDSTSPFQNSERGRASKQLRDSRSSRAFAWQYGLLPHLLFQREINAALPKDLFFLSCNIGWLFRKDSQASFPPWGQCHLCKVDSGRSGFTPSQASQYASSCCVALQSQEHKWGMWHVGSVVLLYHFVPPSVLKPYDKNSTLLFRRLRDKQAEIPPGCGQGHRGKANMMVYFARPSFQHTSIKLVMEKAQSLSGLFQEQRSSAEQTKTVAALMGGLALFNERQTPFRNRTRQEGVTARTGTMTVRTGTKIFPFFHLQAGWNWLNTIKKNKRPVSALVPWAGLSNSVAPPPPLFLDNVLGVLMDQIPKKHFVSTAGHSKLQKIAFEKSLAFFRFVSRRRGGWATSPLSFIASHHHWNQRHQTLLQACWPMEPWGRYQCPHVGRHWCLSALSEDERHTGVSAVPETCVGTLQSLSMQCVFGLSLWGTYAWCIPFLLVLWMQSEDSRDKSYKYAPRGPATQDAYLLNWARSRRALVRLCYPWSTQRHCQAHLQEDARHLWHWRRIFKRWIITRWCFFCGTWMRQWSIIELLTQQRPFFPSQWTLQASVLVAFGILMMQRCSMVRSNLHHVPNSSCTRACRFRQKNHVNEDSPWNPRL